LKLDDFYGVNTSIIDKIFTKEEKQTFSLCDETQMLSTYLQMKEEDIQNVKEIKLILSEMVFNKKSIGLASSLSPSIISIPKLEKEKIGKFTCALLIGPWYFEFSTSSLCVPKRLHPAMVKIFDIIPPFASVNLKLEDVAKTIAPIIASWNVNIQYTSHKPNVKKNQGNSYSFVEEILKQFKVPIKFKGSLFSFVNEIKEHGDAGCSVYPTDYIVEFEEKFGFSYLPEINDHSNHDDKILIMLEEDEDFIEKYPHDYLVFLSIDLAFWIRSLFDDDKSLKPLIDIDDPDLCICPCFKKHLFEEMKDLTIESRNIKEDTEEIPKARKPKTSVLSKKPSGRRLSKGTGDSIFDEVKNDKESAFGGFDSIAKKPSGRFNQPLKKRKSITEAMTDLFSTKNGRRKSITDLFENQNTLLAFDKLHEINGKK
jgi:hypothetical protein